MVNGANKWGACGSWIVHLIEVIDFILTLQEIHFVVCNLASSIPRFNCENLVIAHFTNQFVSHFQTLVGQTSGSMQIFYELKHALQTLIVEVRRWELRIVIFFLWPFSLYVFLSLLVCLSVHLSGPVHSSCPVARSGPWNAVSLWSSLHYPWLRDAWLSDVKGDEGERYCLGADVEASPHKAEQSLGILPPLMRSISILSTPWVASTRNAWPLSLIALLKAISNSLSEWLSACLYQLGDSWYVCYCWSLRLRCFSFNVCLCFQAQADLLLL